MSNNKFRRGQIKAAITRFRSFVDEFIDNPGEHAKLKQRIINLKETVNTLQSITDSLVAAEPENAETHAKIEEELMDSYMDALAIASILQPQPAIQSLSIDRPTTYSPITSSGEYNVCRIPKMELRKFDGSIEDWKPFAQWFKATIDNREGLTASMKLAYLHETLVGEAAKTIAGFENTNENYSVAWDLLKSTYDNDRLIAYKHFDIIMTIPKMQNNSAESIRRVLNEVQTNVLKLKVMNLPVNQWDLPLTYILVSKFDPITALEWNRKLKGTSIPTYDELISFLREEATRMQTVETKQHSTGAKPKDFKYAPSNNKKHALTTTTTYKPCPICKRTDHPTHKCPKLLNMPVSHRINAAKTSKLCFNCLRSNHLTKECTRGKCFKCGQLHHTMLHLEKTSDQNQKHNSTERPQSPSSSQPNASVVLLNRGNVEELMVTAVVKVLDRNNLPITCRALLDTASTSNFMTKKLADTLKLDQQKHILSIGGIGNLQAQTSSTTTTKIQSLYGNFERQLQFFTVPTITQKHPANPIDISTVNIPTGVKLADPMFHKPANIDLLIGAGTSLSTLLPGNLCLTKDNGPDLFLQNTTLGWIIGGAVAYNSRNVKRSNANCHLTTIQALKQINRTWEIEEGPPVKHLTEEEIKCEAHYKTNVKRAEDGKYIVAIPFNSNLSLLGESRSRALKRFKILENKFKRQPEFEKAYSMVMQEYIDLGHMELAHDSNSESFYLPHHAVVKESSLTTKIRVVFDGSAQSSTGISLNDAQMVGPTIQDNLITHLLRFRLHIYVLTGDVEKMYRQTWVQPNDRNYQRVLWKDSDGTIKDYQLTTVTFGLASSPFLAIRTLQQLAKDEEKAHPIASKTIMQNMYVDDLLTGANTLQQALSKRNDLIAVFKSGGLNIRKWASNDQRLLDGIPEEDINDKVKFETDPSLKTLGIKWHSTTDTIHYELKEIPVDVTMRIILSEVAKIFDPLGLLAPMIIAARLILQNCWKAELTWDQELTPEIKNAWSTFAQQYNNIDEIQFPRSVINDKNAKIDIHGFADASEKAYGACIYLRCSTPTQVSCHLLCAKGKVVPLNGPTLARLELCAAAMLADLYYNIKDRLPLNIRQTVLWSDSSITLHWINKQPYQLKTFVANRVAEIQRKTSPRYWRHVSSEDNPADPLSRGETPNQFIENQSWKHGPLWLLQAENIWPKSAVKINPKDDDESKPLCFAMQLGEHKFEDNFIENFSSLTHLHRTIARVLRLSPHSKATGPLTAEEINNAQNRILFLVQHHEFADDIHNLKCKKLSTSSKLKQLNPFLDNDNILRVGGRLRHANIAYNKMHPIILPKSHHYTTLIIRDTHQRLFHSGIQTTLYTLRQTFWPINGRNECKRVIHRCTRCIRNKPHTAEYIMGDLPKERITQSRPFLHTGVDYCGPFYVKEKKFRNRNKLKAYVAVFVCLATKAVHFEVVGDLTTDSFIAALKRFTARRGKCKTIHSDNATNFVGACNVLKELYQQLNDQEQQQKIQRHLADEGITWKFIPPRSPNFGGLWEAAVKSYKHHMYRMVGETLLTYEELNTLSSEIEAILNSRPLTTISSDPNDPIAITPGHFLIGDAITSIPDKNWIDVPNNRLSSWQQIQKFKQIFWKRWHKDYLNGLNIRHKWHKGQNNIAKNTIVIIKDDNLRPFQWPLAKVIDVHAGADGIIRTVTLKTSSGIIQRSVRNLAILVPPPTEDATRVANSQNDQTKN